MIKFFASQSARSYVYSAFMLASGAVHLLAKRGNPYSTPYRHLTSPKRILSMKTVIRVLALLVAAVSFIATSSAQDVAP